MHDDFGHGEVVGILALQTEERQGLAEQAGRVGATAHRNQFRRFGHLQPAGVDSHPSGVDGFPKNDETSRSFHTRFGIETLGRVHESISVASLCNPMHLRHRIHETSLASRTSPDSPESEEKGRFSAVDLRQRQDRVGLLDFLLRIAVHVR